MQVGVQYLHARGGLDVSRRHLRRALGPQISGHGLVHFGPNHQPLQVQDDVRDVLGNLWDGGELVQHALDLDRRDGGAGDGRQERPAQRVSECVAESRLERLDHEP